MEDNREATGKPSAFEEQKFKAGESGNPAGRPRGSKNGLRARLMQMLDQETETDILKVFEAKGVMLTDKDKAGVIAHVVGREAMKGNMQAVKIISDQTEAPMPKDIKLSQGEGGPIQYVINPVRPVEPKQEGDEDGDKEKE